MITFTRTNQTQDAATGRLTTSTSTITGSAVQVKGLPDRYVQLGLQESEAPTLLFAPTLYGQRPEPGDTVEWNSETWKVEAVDPIAPDGVFIMGRVVISR